MTKVPADKGGPIGLNIRVKPLSITQGTVEREKKMQENNRCGKELKCQKNKKTTNNENYKFYTYYYKNNKQEKNVALISRCQSLFSSKKFCN